MLAARTLYSNMNSVEPSSSGVTCGKTP